MSLTEAPLEDMDLIANINLRGTQYYTLVVSEDLLLSLFYDGHYMAVLTAKEQPQAFERFADSSYAVVAYGANAISCLNEVFDQVSTDIEFFDSLPDDWLVGKGRTIKDFLYTYFKPTNGNSPEGNNPSIQKALERFNRLAVLEKADTDVLTPNMEIRDNTDGNKIFTSVKPVLAPTGPTRGVEQETFVFGSVDPHVFGKIDPQNPLTKPNEEPTKMSDIPEEELIV